MKKNIAIACLFLTHALMGTAPSWSYRVATTTMAAIAGDVVRQYVPRITVRKTIENRPVADVVVQQKLVPWSLSSSLFAHLPALGMAFSLNRNRTGWHEQAIAALATNVIRTGTNTVLIHSLPRSTVIKMLVLNLASAALAESVYPSIVNGVNFVIGKITSKKAPNP